MKKGILTRKIVAGFIGILLVLSIFSVAVSAAEDVREEKGEVVEEGELSDGSPYSLIETKDGEILVSVEDPSWGNQLRGLSKAVQYDGKHNQKLAVTKVTYGVAKRMNKNTDTSKKQSSKKGVIKVKHRN